MKRREQSDKGDESAAGCWCNLCYYSNILNRDSGGFMTRLLLIFLSFNVSKNVVHI